MKSLTPFVKWTVRAGAAAGILVVLVVYLASTSRDTVTQPIRYSHKAHMETAGMACADCHASVLTSPTASLPSLEVCSTCHSDQPISQSVEEIKVLEFVKKGEVIPWQRVYYVPDHVYFSHRRHVTKAGLECKACHGDVPEFTEPVASQFLPVTMENCMQCHRENNVSNDCLTCHR